MDNCLTPKKIQRLIHLAEDKSINSPRRQLMLLNDEDLKRLTAAQNLNKTNSNTNHESSSILDLERVEGFGESLVGSMSLSKSTAFNPGEITGRSTGADNFNAEFMNRNTHTFEEYGRHSLVLDSFTSQMDKQTNEIEDIMRHSISTNYSFHSKRDLTADEASFIQREAPLPVPAGTQSNFAESTTVNNSNMSMGTYFKNRCPDFGKILEKTESPDKSCRPSFGPSITEVSTNAALEYAKESNAYKMDQSLDSVPVKQPRPEKVPDNRIINNLNATCEKINNCNIAGQQEALAGKLPGKVEKSFMNEIHKYGQSSSKMPNPIMSSQKHFMTSTAKPTDVLLRNLQSSLRLMTEDTEGSVENSFSISKIAEYLGRQSDVSVTEMLQMKKNSKKQPLTEGQMNAQERLKSQNVQVANLKDSKHTATTSSAGSINTVISLDKMTIKEVKKDIPEVIITQHKGFINNDLDPQEVEDVKVDRRTTRSKSPSSKSQSSLSTVQENHASFKSQDSPMHSSKGEANVSYVPSPNIEYKELDKSVDWHEVLLQKRLRREGFSKEQWVEIVSTAANGFVGASCPVTITVTTLTDSWLAVKFQFDDLPNNGRDLTVELQRFPLLLSPRRSETLTLHLTSMVEMNTSLPFTLFLKDTSIDGDIEQRGMIDVDIKMPEIQAMSCDGVNKVAFAPTIEKCSVTKSFVLVSDSPVDLQLDLSISEGERMFFIKHAQEVNKSDINKVLMDHQGSSIENSARGKKITNKQLCRLSSRNAIKVTVIFNAPKFSDLQITDNIASFGGVLNVNLMGVKTVLRKIELISIVGTLNLVVDVDRKLHLTSEPKAVMLQNSGTIPGVWVAKFANANQSYPINCSPSKFDLRPGGAKSVTFTYTGFDDNFIETSIVFEEINTGLKTTIDVSAGAEKPKIFPIKTNHSSLSWVRTGRKELSLKNCSNTKVHVKCQIIGDAFSIDLPGAESRGTYLLPFGPMECRTIPIVFNPISYNPCSATLYMVFDKASEVSGKVKLYGCASGDTMRWSGLVTYGDTALVRAISRTPVTLNLYNKSPMPAFVCAKVHFNLQYLCVGVSARLSGGSHVVEPRARHAVSLEVEWARVERRARDAAAATLATLTLLTGAEYTRRRILRIIRDETTGELDTSLLPDHLKVLTQELEGEDRNMDDSLADFKESKASLSELIDGIHELTAQIDLPQDFSDENTIIISDDTVIEHHTLCDQ